MKVKSYFLVAFILLFSPIKLAFSLTENNQFLVLSDIHLKPTSSHTMEISPSKRNLDNELDLSSFYYLLASINQAIKLGVVKNPKFIIILGDVAQYERNSPNDILQSESQAFKTLKMMFPKTPIFYTFGNNDALDTDYGSFIDKKRVGPQSPFDVARLNGWENGFLSTGKKCNNKIYPCLISENTDQGYYSAYIESGFRLIALNTVQFSYKRKAVPQSDAVQQLQWLAEQLKSAAQNHESVLITMHIPFGNNIYDHTPFWQKPNEDTFLRLVSTYQENIVGILAGHTHSDELKVIQDKEGKTIGGVFITAGLSTSHGNEPATTLFSYTKEDKRWRLSNYKTYHFSQDKSVLCFSELYDFSQDYCKEKSDDVEKCLKNVSAKKIYKYFNAGNKKYPGQVNSPEDVFIKIP